MSENPVKNHGIKPQRNSPCKETRKRRYTTRRNVFLPGLNQCAQYRTIPSWDMSTGRSAIQAVSNATLAASKAEIEKSKQLEKCMMYLVQLNNLHYCQLRQVINSYLPRYSQSIGSVHYTNRYQASHVATPNPTLGVGSYLLLPNHQVLTVNNDFLIVGSQQLQCFC